MYFNVILSLYTYLILCLATIRVNPPSWSQLAIFIGGKITHCILRFVIPGFFMPISSLVGVVTSIDQ